MKPTNDPRPQAEKERKILHDNLNRVLSGKPMHSLLNFGDLEK